MPKLRALSAIALFAAVHVTNPALALNKQGLSISAAEGADADKAPAQNVTGYVFAGALFYNPSYAARPDNTGRALTRWGGHLDLDLDRKYLTLTYDGNVFSDRDASSAARPSEHDHILGLLTRHGPLELGVHYETDRPADRAGDAQTYVDLDVRGYYDLFRAWPGLARTLPHQACMGFFTLAGFAYNRTYAARPDLSGLAMLRLVGHSEIDLYKPWLTFSIDLNFFTDRTVHAGLVPSELDITVGLVAHAGDFDVAVVAENDRPVDRGGVSQSYASLLLTYRFDVRGAIASMKSHPELARVGR